MCRQQIDANLNVAGGAAGQGYARPTRNRHVVIDDAATVADIGNERRTRDTRDALVVALTDDLEGRSTAGDAATEAVTGGLGKACDLGGAQPGGRAEAVVSNFSVDNETVRRNSRSADIPARCTICTSSARANRPIRPLTYLKRSLRAYSKFDASVLADRVEELLLNFFVCICEETDAHSGSGAETSRCCLVLNVSYIGG